MSRSRKKTPIGGGTTAPSEKANKKWWHRKFRRKIAVLAGHAAEDGYPLVREVINVYDMNKDGKGWYGQYPALRKKNMRK